MNRQAVRAVDSAQADIHAAIQQVQAGSHSAADLEVLRQAIVAGQITIAGGDRAVAIGGNAEGAVIVTGTGNTIAVDGPSAVALRELFADIKELKIQGHSRATHDPRARENRRRMLTRVRRTWIDGYLQDSLHGAPLQSLGLEERPDAVPERWGMVLQQQERPTRTLPSDTRIVNVYDDLDGDLLILGEPGSGKTTVLLELTSALIRRALQDEALPIPVVFNLASWSRRRLPLTDWLVDELTQRYDLPHLIAEAWVAEDRILPLLDGLDEVALNHRAGCLESINAYRHGRVSLSGLVVTSRVADYEALIEKVRLRGAVRLQPLLPEQIDQYLASAGEQLSGVRAALLADQNLREMATSPLLLRTMTLAYQGLPSDAVPTAISVEELRRQLFAAYVEKMFKRRGKPTRYSASHTLHWLAWLANVMSREAQTTLYLESLQPDWLPTLAARRAYAMVDRLGSALLVGVVVGLPVQALAGDWVAALLIATTCGLAAGLLGGDRAPHAGLQRGARPMPTRAALGGLAAGLVSGGVITALMGNVRPPLTAIEFGLVIGSTIFGLAYALNAGPRAVSWPLLRGAIVRGLIGGTAGAAIGGLVGFAVLAIIVGSAWQVVIAVSVTLVREGPVAAFELSGPIGSFGGFGLLYGLAIGLLGSAVTILIDHVGAPSASRGPGRRAAAHNLAGSALVLGILSGGATALLQLGPSVTLLWGVLSGTLGAFVGGVAGGPSVRPRRVALVEPTRWSSPTAVRAALKGLLFGLLWGTLVLGTMFGVFAWQLQPSDEEILVKLGSAALSGPQDALISAANAAIAGGVSTGLMFGLVWGILRGLDVADVEASPMPGQGLRRSARRAILMGLGCFGAIALLALAATLLGGAVPELFPDVWTVVIGSVLLAVLFGVGGALSHGASAVLSHLVLRLVLWRTDELPIDTIRFLDYATERIFLRRVGGGYIFVHRLLQEYFASLEPEQPQTRVHE